MGEVQVSEQVNTARNSRICHRMHGHFPACGDPHGLAAGNEQGAALFALRQQGTPSLANVADQD
jgi:hypothetical protein